MSKRKRIFNLQELLKSSRLIADGKLKEVSSEEWRQLEFFFDLDQKDIVENIQEIIEQLEKIIQVQEEFPAETFTAFVPRDILIYWQEKAQKLTKTKKEINQLVEQNVAAWIAGLRKNYQSATPQEFVQILKQRQKKIEKIFKKRTKAIRKLIAPLEKTIAQTTSKETAQQITEKILFSPEINSPRNFARKLKELLYEEKVPLKKASQLASFFSNYYPQVKQALYFKAQQREVLGSTVDWESATNLPLKEPPEEVKDQIKPPAEKNLQEEWQEVASWWQTQGYPGQTLLALVKADPGIFKGGAKEIINNIKKALLPGLPLQSQLLIILSAGKEELAARKIEAIRGAYDALYGEGSFKKEYQKFLQGSPSDEENLKLFALGKIDEIKKHLKDYQEGKEIKVQGKLISFKQKEDFLLYNRLLDLVDKIEELSQNHPFLAGLLRGPVKILAFPLRHQTITTFYQLSKVGPYAPRVIIEELLIKQTLRWFWRSSIVRLTSKFSWGWEVKKIPFVGTKVVWKPLEKAKSWFKEKASKIFGKILKKLGLKKLVLALAGGGIVGSLLAIFKKPIKKALKVLGLFFISMLNWAMTYGPLATTFFGIGAVGGGIGGVVVGLKVGGILGAAVGGPLGVFLGAGLGTLLAIGLIKGWQSLTGWWQGTTASVGTTGMGGLTGISLTANAIIAPATLVGLGTLAAGTIILTSSAFIIPIGQKTYGSKYIQIQKGFDINGQPQKKLEFQNEEIIGQKINYGLRINIVDKDLHQVKVNDRLEIIKEKTTVYQEKNWDLGEMKANTSWEQNYAVLADESFQNSYLANIVTVSSQEGEKQTLVLELTIGNPPVPASVALAKRIVSKLLACPELSRQGLGVVVSRTSWPQAKACLESTQDNQPAIPQNIINLLGRFETNFYYLQCVHFVVAVTNNSLPSKPAARDYCHQSIDGYTLHTDWNNIQLGDIIASDRSEAGHVAIVTSLPPKNSKKEFPYIGISEAIGTNGVVQTRQIDHETLLSNYCGYLRKGG